nr:hypothetical protein [Tanacetum cinerariifolium]
MNLDSWYFELQCKIILIKTAFCSGFSSDFHSCVDITPSRSKDLKKRLGSRHARGMSGSPEPRRNHSESPRKRDLERKMVFKRLEKGVFHRLEDKRNSTSAYSNDSRRDHTTLVTETLKAATRVLAQEK